MLLLDGRYHPVVVVRNLTHEDCYTQRDALARHYPNLDLFCDGGVFSKED